MKGASGSSRKKEGAYATETTEWNSGVPNEYISKQHNRAWQSTRKRREGTLNIYIVITALKNQGLKKENQALLLPALLVLSPCDCALSPFNSRTILLRLVLICVSFQLLSRGAIWNFKPEVKKKVENWIFRLNWNLKLIYFLTIIINIPFSECLANNERHSCYLPFNVPVNRTCFQALICASHFNS